MQMTKTDQKSIVMSVAAALLVAGAYFGIVYADTASTSVSVGNASPTLSSVAFNSGTNLTLTESTYVWASTTLTATDTNGCSDISSVTAKFYLASTSNTGTQCSMDDNSCYLSTCVATTTGNTCAGGADTSAQYDCGFKVWYIANPTDSSAPVWATSIWSVSATATDASAATGNATNTAQTIEVVTLNALSLSGNISYPATAAGADTGATNQTLTVTNTGNTKIDNQISGVAMCTDYPTCSGSTIAATQQKFGTSDVTYASLANTLSTTPTSIQFNIAKPTATTTASTQASYWGVAIPGGQTAGSYTGLNTITAIADF